MKLLLKICKYKVEKANIIIIGSLLFINLFKLIKIKILIN